MLGNRGGSARFDYLSLWVRLVWVFREQDWRGALIPGQGKDLPEAACAGTLTGALPPAPHAPPPSSPGSQGAEPRAPEDRRM